MSIANIGAILFGLSFGINHFISLPLLALLAAIGAIMWGAGLLLGK